MLSITDLHTKLVDALDIAHLAPEDQERVVEQMGSMVYQRVLLAVFDKIPAEEHEKLKHLIAANLEDEISALVAKHVPNAEEVVATALAESFADYEAAMKGTA